MLRFLRDVEEHKRRRAQKSKAALQALRPQRKMLSQEDAEAFFDRLLADGERRKATR